MFGLYSLLFFLSFLLYLPLYVVRARLVRRESICLAPRLGLGLKPAPSGRKTLWIHAVSVGEVLSLQSLVRKIKKEHPEWIVLFSSLTPSGLRLAREKLVEADRVFTVPLDFRWIVRKFFARLQPDVFVLAESEFWPNLLREAGEKAKGVLVINGRISPKSFRRYLRVKPLIRRVLTSVDRFLVQSDRDRTFLLDLGVTPEKVEVAGNLKCDLEPPVVTVGEVEERRKQLGVPQGIRVVVAGSVRKGEETPLVEAFAAARREDGDVRLVIAPRHLERAAEAERICQKYGLSVSRRTTLKPGTEWDVLILDTFGELAFLYALSDRAFIGGSLVPWGGHNLLEPAFFGKPVFFGPHMENFAHLAEAFLQAGAARLVVTHRDLVDMFSSARDEELREMGKRAREALRSLQGATEKSLRAIEKWMEMV